MYYLKTSASFDSAHFLSGYRGKCSNLHGHRWTIEVQISGETLQESGTKRGMLLDFGDVKHAVRELADSYDHALLYEENSLQRATVEALLAEGFRLIPLPFRPTAENLAKSFYDTLSASAIPVSCVTVYETPDNCASYEVSNK